MSKYTYTKMFNQIDKSVDMFIKNIKKLVKHNPGEVELVDIYSTFYTTPLEDILTTPPIAYFHSGKLVYIKYKYTGFPYSMTGLNLPVCTFIVNITKRKGAAWNPLRADYPKVNREIVPESVFWGDHFTKHWEESVLQELKVNYETIFSPWYIYMLYNHTKDSAKFYQNIVGPFDIISNKDKESSDERLSFMTRVHYNSSRSKIQTTGDPLGELSIMESSSMQDFLDYFTFWAETTKDCGGLDLCLKRGVMELNDEDKLFLLKAIHKYTLKNFNGAKEFMKPWYQNFLLHCLGGKSKQIQDLAYSIYHLQNYQRKQFSIRPICLYHRCKEMYTILDR